MKMTIKLRSRNVAALCAASLTLWSCADNKDGQNEQAGMEMHMQEMNENYVDTMVLKKRTFNQQIVCNGRLKAKAKSELNFPGAGIVDQVCVKEGQRIAKGTVIATLDNGQRERELQRAEHELQRSKIELTDKLIGLGYEDWDKVPEEVMKRAEVMSGYYAAKYQLQTARRELDDCILKAPFSGRVANLEAKAYQRNEKVCVLVDDSEFDVEFQILEAELFNVRVGQDVKVTPFVRDSLQYLGKVKEINPLVDENGLVKVRARLANSNHSLLDGMNVKIVVEKEVEQMFVVPKDAVLERDGYHVVFRLENGCASWTYVDVLQSNISAFAITGCKRKNTKLKEGDVVITSGNLNLADGTPVKVGHQ